MPTIPTADIILAVETELGRDLTATEQAQVTQWHADAEMQIEARLGDLTELDQTRLAYVIRRAVLARLQAFLRNEMTSTTVTVDDGTITNRWESGGAVRVEILDEWWTLLSPITETGAWTIRPYGSGTAGVI